MGTARCLRSLVCLGAVCTSLVAAVPVVGQTRLLRFPDVHGDQIVFTYAGDLWLASAEGGTARRLTAHPGLELLAKFSPDGNWIAFTGQYDGDEQIYVIPAAGGVPKQLTYYPARGPLPDRWGYDNLVYGWTPDSRKVLFRSLRDGWSVAAGRLYTVSIEGGLAEALPMPRAGAGDFAPDGRRLAYSPLFRDFRTWKRYEGGWAQDLYLFDLETQEQTQITDHPRTDRDPMWIGDCIFFASDRSGTLNLHSYDPGSKELRQWTKSKQFDVRWPSKADDDRIVYELGGELYLLKVGTGKSQTVSIRVPTDGLAMRPQRVSVAGRISGFAISPKGERALFTARGDVFTAPIEKGPTRNLTQSSGAHDKLARWSPDGSKIAFLSDRDGEEELYLIDPTRQGQLEQLTDGGSAMRYEPVWSPDGKRIALSDKDGRVFVLTVADKQLREVANERYGQVHDYVWSPCGGHLAFSLESENGMRAIHVWSVADGQLRKLTGDDFNAYNPAWDPEGKYLYYLSDREFAPQLAAVEWNFAANRQTGIFALSLRKDVPHPFPVESDEVEVATASGKAEASPNDAGLEREKKEGAKRPKKRRKSRDSVGKESSPADKTEYLKIDFDGIAHRAAMVPVEAENYRELSAVKGHLLFVRDGSRYYGRGSDVKPELRIFSLKTRKATTLAENASGYALAATGNKVLVRQDDGFVLLDASAESKGEKKTVSTSGLMADVDPRAEWRQIFGEVWRRFRDFFYVENMHGYDWQKLRDQYEPLLEHVAHRSDLNYVIGEMIAELNVGHAYNTGGDFLVPERPQVALPGARFALDPGSGRYRIARILRGQNEESLYRAPLTEIGLDVREGDYVLAIDGQELKSPDDPYRLLRNKADRLVALTVNDRPDLEGSRTISFRPIKSEQDLLYLDWVRANRRRVEEATQGRVGYLHLPDMGAAGIREFNKWYYSQLRKEGLVIDVRGNGGGNISAMVLERLRRTLLGTWFARTNERTETYPSNLLHGHLVCLLDENSASDGDIFPASFRQAGLGVLIGKRSWGGVVGITNHGDLIDGGSVNVPEFAFASPDGKWILEGRGVEPDIEVENDPQSLIEGRDPQLERAIQEVLDRIQAAPKTLPDRPAPPVKTARGSRAKPDK